MGLDMYLYRVSRVTEEQKAKFIENMGEWYDEDEDCFVISIMKNELNEKMYSDLIPYLEEVTVTREYFDFDRIKEDNNIPEDAELTGRNFSSPLRLWFRDNDDNQYEVTIDNEEQYVYKKDETVYIAYVEEIDYWRKGYGLQREIHEHLNNEVENCGYYRLDYEFAKSISDTVKATDAVFYHEWY